MNSGDGGQDTESLKGFYAYKNTFDKKSTWVSIPKKSMFCPQLSLVKMLIPPPRSQVRDQCRPIRRPGARF